MSRDHDPLASTTCASKRAYDLIADKLARVEEELLLHFRSPIPTIDRIGTYLAQGGGKRIRPALLLLSARLLDYAEGDKDVRYAAVVEFIHTATLVHDDIIDEAQPAARPHVRQRPLGQQPDGPLRRLPLHDVDGHRARRRRPDDPEGALGHDALDDRGRDHRRSRRKASIHVTREEALEITRRKTADLFSAACRLPAHFAPRGDLVAAERLAEYGRCLGMAFQLIDDLLDYTGSVEEVGKPVLNDLREGKLTMPLLLALPRASAAEREQGGRGAARARLQERPSPPRSSRSWIATTASRRRARWRATTPARRASRSARFPDSRGEGRPAARDRIGHRPHSLSPPGAP